MSEQEGNGLSLEGLAQRLEALEGENERMRSENAELRDEVAELRSSPRTEGGVPAAEFYGPASMGAQDYGERQEPAVEFVGPASMGEQEEEYEGLSLQGLAQRLEELERGGAAERLEELERDVLALRQELAALRAGRRSSLLRNAGAAALGLVGAGARAQRDVRRELDFFEAIDCETSESAWPAVRGQHSSGGKGVEGTTNSDYNPGVYGSNWSGGPGPGTGAGPGVKGKCYGDWGVAIVGEAKGHDGTGVQGFGDISGVWGASDRAGYHGVTRVNSNRDGTGVRGITSNDNGRAGVRGLGSTGVWGSSPKHGYSGVYGQHAGSDGYGIVGDGTGRGSGVLGRNSSGYGVIGEGKHAGVSGTSTVSFGVVGDGAGEYPGVMGIGGHDEGSGVFGTSTNGYGGSFVGGKAPLRLIPKESTGRPTSGTHAKGELYLDSAGALFVCTREGTPGTWRQVTTTAA